MRRKSRLGQTDDQQNLPFMRDYRYLRNNPPEEGNRAWMRYQKEFDDYGHYSPGSMQRHEKMIDESYYLGSVLSAKADPLGRFIFMDLRTWRPEGERYFKYVTLALAGAQKPTVFGGVYFDKYETDSSRGGDYYRQHGGPGARVQRTGLGAALYPGSALACAMTSGTPGTFSPRTGSNHNRTREADKLWDSMVDSGLAETESGGSDTETSSQEHCVHVNGDTITGFDANGDEVEGTITSDEVCGEVDYEYDSSVEEDFLDSETIFKNTPLFVWPTTGDSGRRPMMMNSKYEFDRNTAGYSQIAVQRPTYSSEPELDLLTGYYGTTDTTADKYVFPELNKETAEMLAAAYHGSSVDLIFDIATVLQKSTGEDLFVAYLRRLDVSKAVQEHPERMAQYLELLGQQRLPGVGRLSLAGINEVRSVHRAVRLGQLKVDPHSDNPLHIPKVSSRTQRKLDKLPQD